MRTKYRFGRFGMAILLLLVSLTLVPLAFLAGAVVGVYEGILTVIRDFIGPDLVPVAKYVATGKEQ